MEGNDSAKLMWNARTVPISEIDLEDDTCHLGSSVDPAHLVASIETVGLINPPALKQRQDKAYRIVCGFRRVMACRALGWQEIESRVLSGRLPDFDLLKLAILDNRSHRPFGVVEQSQGVKKLSPHIPPQDRLQLLSSLLGFPQNQKVFQKLETLASLPEPIQRGVTKETISFEAAVSLKGLSLADALSCFELLKSLKLSQSKQTEIIAWIQEISMREDIQPAEVSRAEEVKKILERPDMNRNEKSSALRAYLKRRRFPNLTKAEERFSREAQALKLGEHIRITPPSNFEGGPYLLRMTFKTVAEVNQRLEALKVIAGNPALKRLLDPFE
jgi:ParB family chromosome partitioning protein